MWHCWPCTRSCPLSDPRRPFLIVSPKRWVEVGSPTTHASMVSPRARRASTTAAVPSTASPSSSDVSRMATDPRPAAARATRSAAVIMAATDAFMSAAPRPYSRPSRSAGVKGSLVHCSIGPGGTTSTWPARQTSGPDDPWRAHRLLTGPRSSRSHRKPAAARRDSSSARLPPSAGVTERQAMSSLASRSVSPWMPVTCAAVR